MDDFSSHRVLAMALATGGLTAALLGKLLINRLLPAPAWEDYPEALKSDPTAALVQSKKVVEAEGRMP